MDNPFKEASRRHRLFEVLKNADRPLRPEEIAGAVGKHNAMVAHTMLKDLRARGTSVYRYRDPEGESPTASVYSLRPVEGLSEIAAQRRPRTRPGSGPPTPIRPTVRQPQVGSVARVTAVLLADDGLSARVECDGTVYAGTVAAAQPTVGDWVTVVTVGLHGQGLYVDLAGARVVTLENLREDTDGR